MPKLYHQIGNFLGLANRKDARDTKGLSKAQNISLDIGGKIRTIGGLETHGASGLTSHGAILCPGSGLFVYGSDHWRGTDTIIDLLDSGDATSDKRTEGDSTAGWTDLGETLASKNSGELGFAPSVGTYAMEILPDEPYQLLVSQAFTTVKGQRYLASADLRATSNGDRFRILISKDVGVPSVISESEPVSANNVWQTKQVEFIAEDTETYFYLHSDTDTSGAMYADNVYVTAIPQADVDTTWLALADVANAQVDLYNSIDDSFLANALDFGTVASFVGASAGNIDFPTTNTLTDSQGTLLNSNIKAGKVYKISGCSTTTANNLLFVCKRVGSGTVFARGNPFTVQAAEAGTVTLTEYNPTDFHFVDDSLSVSPTGGGIALRPKQNRFVDRIHFKDAGSSEDKYQNWYLNDVGLSPPTDIEATTNNGDQAASNLTAGAGFEIGITTTADDGEWSEGTYIIAIYFTYDDGQYTELYVPSTDEEFGTAIVDKDSLTLTLRAKGPYDERISGGGIVCRLDETDDPWVLLADISMELGARATLSGAYNAWAESSTATVAYTSNFKSVRPNTDTYESISGSTPDAKIEKFTSDNRYWDFSIIAGNRTFIFGPRYEDNSGKTVHFRDRILYSKINQYDVFPIDNYIDVTGSDAEDYVAGGVYGSDLLAFKQNTLYIIDISDPLLFKMKEDKQKGKYPFRGISRPGAYFETPHGPAWCNRFGIWLYNGVEVVDLLGDRVERSKHPLAYQGYYEFDGDDYVDAGSGITGLGNGQSLVAWVNAADLTPSTSATALANSTGSNDRSILQLNTAGDMVGAYYDGSYKAKSGALSAGWHLIVFTYDGTTPILYIDAVVQTGSTSPFAAATDKLMIGARTDLTAGQFWTGGIAGVEVLNRVLSSSEVTDLLGGTPVLAADKWASQTDIITDSNDRGGFDGATNWGDFSLDSFNEAGGDLTVGSTASGQECRLPVTDATTVIGERYRVQVTGANQSGDAFQLRSFDSAQTFFAILADGLNSIEFTAETTGGLRVRATGTGTMDLDDFTIIRIGVVAEYLPENITDSVWTDTSDNSLDGTVNGATFIYPDTWEHFWTDYSILGYYGKTNQLIVMRDCTGKYSSGQDYGDCVILDLDTLFLTTGRRVFTKGAAYTNFATDWNGDLIIGRQSSSNIITEKWTDKPQSQAVGLIDIRTADIDFNNPAIIDIIDAFTTTYKSSAAQTKPLSYALDGDDSPTAWTRITGNFSAKGFWEKFLAQPGSFNCNTIRLRIDNPTNAGTIEINELVIRHDPQEVKLN